MSDTDSFIDEVSEEVRREKLFGYLKRYGWIGVVLVLALVGGAAYNEWRKASAQAAAQATGDAVIAALEAEVPADRVTALGDIEAGTASPVIAMLAAAEQERVGDIEGAVATLDAVVADQTVSRDYRDLAAMKSLMLSEGIMDATERRAALEAMAAPGAQFRMIALEQLVLADLGAGETDAALAGLVAIVEDAGVTDGLRDRSMGLIVALGGEIDPAWMAAANEIGQ